MKRSFFLAASVAASLSLFGCGDDSSASTDNVDRESADEYCDVDDPDCCAEDDPDCCAEDDPDCEGSEDPADEKSSDSKGKSSSSVADDESSSSEESKTRAATLDDFNKNSVLKGFLGTDIGFSVGAKKGLFTFWLPGPSQDSAWVVAHADFKDGKLKINSDNATLAYVYEKGTVEKMQKMISSGTELTFVVDGEQLQYSDNGKDFSNVEAAKVKVDENAISSADTLWNKKLTCSVGDTTNSYYFYDGQFMMLSDVDESNVNWVSGYADIQHSKLLMMTSAFMTSAQGLYTGSVSTDYVLEISGKKMECKKTNLEKVSFASKDLVGEWTSVDEDKVSWNLEFKEDGTYSMLAKQGQVEIRNGNWNLVGNIVTLSNEECLDVACLGVYGVISNFKAGSSFEIEHSAVYPDDGEEHPPVFPSTWKAAQYE